MAKQKKEEVSEHIKGSEVFPLMEESSREGERDFEIQEKQEELTPEQLKQAKENIEKAEIDDSLKIQATSQVQNIKLLDEEKKIKKLIGLAKAKGVIYAVLVAKKLGDPFVLDALHDFLAKEGHYKQFLK